MKLSVRQRSLLRILLYFAISAFIGIRIWQWSLDTYEGLTAEQWFRIYYCNLDGRDFQPALRHFGTNLLPLMVETLSEEHSKLKQAYRHFYYNATLPSGVLRVLPKPDRPLAIRQESALKVVLMLLQIDPAGLRLVKGCLPRIRSLSMETDEVVAFRAIELVAVLVTEDIHALSHPERYLAHKDFQARICSLLMLLGTRQGLYPGGRMFSPSTNQNPPAAEISLTNCVPALLEVITNLTEVRRWFGDQTPNIRSIAGTNLIEIAPEVALGYLEYLK